VRAKVMLIVERVKEEKGAEEVVEDEVQKF
jgi:hypothetical protein